MSLGNISILLMHYRELQLDLLPATTDFKKKQKVSWSYASPSFQPAMHGTVEDYRKAQVADPVCLTVMKYCQQEWPDQHNIASEIKPYWKVRGNLTVTKDSLLMYDRRIVVAKSMQRQTLEKIHTGHQGIERCRLQAKSSVWWAGISQTIANVVQQCSACAKHRTSRSEPMILHHFRTSHGRKCPAIYSN